ncbi:MAG: carboxypeptidase-like regulatory domain-containing protein [Bacteroidales bacterium]|nr:carboxypeptidase-like regulatory domain-containing protein [Bacteroidales bacterium]
MIKRLSLILLMGTIMLSCSKDIEEELTTGDIVGSVSDVTTGEPVATVNVALSMGGKQTVTGSDGAFAFNNLDEGVYTLTINKEGYKSNSASVSVRGGETTNAHMLIERIPAKITSDKDLLEFGDSSKSNVLSFTIVNTWYSPLSWKIANDCTWIKSITPSSSTLAYGKTETIVVTIDRDLLTPGKNETVIVVATSDGNTEVKITAIGEARENIVLNTLEVSELKESSVTFNGEIVNPGIPQYTTRGFVYSTSSMPTLETTIAKLTYKVTEDKKYACSVTGLTKGETYYVRAYAQNSKGVAYSSNEVKFTLTASATQITTQEVSNIDISAGRATLNASVIAGTPIYSEKGFCYSTTPEPTIEDNKRVVGGSGSGSFSCDIADIEQQTTYYVRAYAIQNGEVIYGSVKMFNTNYIKTSIETSSATNIGSTSANLNGTIYDVGNPNYTERGFVYTTSAYSQPTINSNKIVVNGTTSGDYSYTLSSLSYRTTYYYRAYAIQDGEAVYGVTKSFETLFIPTVVSTSAATKVTETEARLNGSISNSGTPAYTERGFCISTYRNPDLSDKISLGKSSISSFSYNAENLREGTTYYVRAYAIQDGEAVYGNEISFTTSKLPVVYTNNVSGLKQTDSYGLSYTVTLNARIADEGLPAYSSKGFVYSTNGDPEAGGTRKTVSGKGTGSYSLTLNGLMPNIYYVRAFVKTSSGKYIYGEKVTFNMYW